MAFPQHNPLKKRKCLGKISNSWMPGQLRKSVTLIEEKSVFGKDA